MQNVEIYTTQLCGFCHRAKGLLKSKGVSFAEYDVSRDAAKRQEMMQRSNGGRTVPQIFIGGKHIGGSDELAMLERGGKLDAILKG